MPKATPDTTQLLSLDQARRESLQLLTLEQIASAEDRPQIEVAVPEWGGKVQVRGLSYDQLSTCRQRAWDTKRKETNEDELNAWCLALGVVSPKINTTTAKLWIAERSFGPVNTILSAILKASGLGGAATSEAKSEPAAE
jgi:hypothetical protein